MRSLRLVIALGLAHGLADGAAGWMLAAASVASPSSSSSSIVALLLIYNSLAFAGQGVAGFIVDRAGRAREAAAVGLGLIAFGLVLMPWSHAGAAIAAGCGSALFHVAGGALSIAATPQRAAGPGIFSAPGVLGLAIGGALATIGLDIHWPLAALLAIVAAIVIALTDDAAPLGLEEPTVDRAIVRLIPSLDLHDLIMAALLAGIALRSFVWLTVSSTVHAMDTTSTTWLIALAAAAACGKLAGGFLADIVGWRRWTLASSIIAAPLLAAGRWRAWLLLPGVALLQSTTPVGIAAAGWLLPRHRATAAGLVLGVAIAIGGAAPTLGFVPDLDAWPILAGVAAVAAAMLMGLGLPRDGRRASRRRTSTVPTSVPISVPTSIATAIATVTQPRSHS